MSHQIHEPGPAGTADISYFRTANGSRLHLPQCPHLVDTEVHPASAAERLLHPVCVWSLAELGGFGRERFEHLEDAIRRLGVPVEAHPAILAAMRFVEFDEVFTVHSLTYAGLALAGRTVAGFGKSYYWVGDRRVNLPAYVGSSRSGRTGPTRYGEICPVHHLVTDLSGGCDRC